MKRVEWYRSHENRRKTTVKDGNEARTIAQRHVGEGGDVLGDLKTGFIVNPDIGPTHAVVAVRNLDTLGSSVVHHFFKRIVFKQSSKVTVGVGLDIAINVVIEMDGLLRCKWSLVRIVPRFLLTFVNPQRL